MQVEVTLKNYRCFPDSQPVRILMRPGFTSLVGANNAGKSALLRFFYDFRHLFQMLADGNIHSLIDKGTMAFNFSDAIADNVEVFHNRNNRDLTIDLRLTDMQQETTQAQSLTRFIVTIDRETRRARGQGFVGETPFDNKVSEILGAGVQTVGKPKVDLTAMRQVCADFARCFYVGPFRNALNMAGQPNHFDTRVGTAFISEWRTRKTGKIKAHNEAVAAVTKSIKNIFGFDDLEINPSDDGTTLQLLIDGKSYRIGELGSGLTHFVIVFVNLAISNSSYVLIDEPELGLHPALQLDFLTALGSLAKHGVVFATHSYGLARACADQIYSVRRLPDKCSAVAPLEDTPSTRLSELLGALSISGYKDLGFDKVLLVEGVTEVRTIQQFLRLYRKDHQVVLLPLGGGQMIQPDRVLELEEVKRISPNVFAVIDSERASETALPDKSRTGFAEACETAKIKCHILDRRATENYLSDRAVKQALSSDKYRALAPYEDLRKAPLSWDKQENWRIAGAMTKEEIDGTDLGRFLREL